MRGPVWNDPNKGVTGEQNFRTLTPNFETFKDSEGKTRTVVGEAAETFRVNHLHGN